MASSSNSDQVDLEKAYGRDATSPAAAASSPIGTCHDALGKGNDRDCEGWAAGQDTLAPVCSRAGSQAHGLEEGRENGVGHDDEDKDESEDNDGPVGGVMGRVLSRITSKSSVDPGPPPDGGWVAWTQCKCSS